MAWPATRLTTYAPGSQIKSSDLNALQDEAIATHAFVADLLAFKHGNRQMVIPSSAFVSDDAPTIGYETSSGAAGPDTLGRWLATANGSNFVAPLILPVGSRLVAAILYLKKVGSGHVSTFTIGRTALASDSVDVIGQVATGTGTGHLAPIQSGLSSIPEATFTNAHEYWLEVDNIWIGDYVKGCLVTYDFP